MCDIHNRKTVNWKTNKVSSVGVACADYFFCAGGFWIEQVVLRRFFNVTGQAARPALSAWYRVTHGYDPLKSRVNMNCLNLATRC